MLTKCSNIQEELKDDDESIKGDKDDYRQVEPVVMEDILHTSTPPTHEGKVNVFIHKRQCACTHIRERGRYVHVHT